MKNNQSGAGWKLTYWAEVRSYEEAHLCHLRSGAVRLADGQGRDLVPRMIERRTRALAVAEARLLSS